MAHDPFIRIWRYSWRSKSGNRWKRDLHVHWLQTDRPFSARTHSSLALLLYFCAALCFLGPFPHYTGGLALPMLSKWRPTTPALRSFAPTTYYNELSCSLPSTLSAASDSSHYFLFRSFLYAQTIGKSTKYDGWLQCTFSLPSSSIETLLRCHTIFFLFSSSPPPHCDYQLLQNISLTISVFSFPMHHLLFIPTSTIRKFLPTFLISSS